MVCVIDDCDEQKIYSRGMCRRHYSSAWKHGQLDGKPRAYRPARRDRSEACAWCGDQFVAVYRHGGSLTRCCSRSCARSLDWALERSGIIRARGYASLDPAESIRLRKLRADRSLRKRREHLASVRRERYSLEDVARRDSHTCQVCECPIDMSLRWPDLLAPTIDHVVPLSRGGEDTLSNVQLACFICNLVKHDRLLEEVLAAPE